MPQTRPEFSRIAEFLQQQNVSMALTTSLSQLEKTKENQTQSLLRLRVISRAWHLLHAGMQAWLKLNTKITRENDIVITEK